MTGGRRLGLRQALAPIAAAAALLAPGCKTFIDPTSSGAPVAAEPAIAPAKFLEKYDASSVAPVPGEVFQPLVESMDAFDPSWGIPALEWISGSEAGAAWIQRLNDTFNAKLVDDPKNPNPDLRQWWNSALENGQISKADLQFFADRTRKAWAATPPDAGILPQQVQFLRVFDTAQFANRAALVAAAFQVATGEGAFPAAMKKIADRGEGAYPTPQQKLLGQAAYKEYAKLVDDVNEALSKRSQAASLIGGDASPAPKLELQPLGRQASSIAEFLAVLNQAQGVRAPELSASRP